MGFTLTGHSNQHRSFSTNYLQFIDSLCATGIFLTLCVRVFENMVLRRIFGPRRDEVTGEWRLHNEQLNDLYSSPNIVRVIKSRRMRWAGYVARMGEERVGV